MTTETELLAKAREIALHVCANARYQGMEFHIAREAALAALRSTQVPADIVQTAHWLVKLEGLPFTKDIRTVAQWVLDTAAVNEGDTK
jgi:hypothetical protein